MRSGQKKQLIFCLEHEFNLKPLRDNLYFKEVSVSFCQGKQDKRKGGCDKSSNQDSCLCCPTFNKDGSHATNAFILAEEQENFIQNSQKYRMEHDEKVRDYNDEKSDLLIPKPKTKYSYCNACRANYEDYLEHIRSKNHKICVRSHQYNYFILELQCKYQCLNSDSHIKSKNHETADTPLDRFSQSDPELQMLGLPSKRAKKDRFSPASELPKMNLFNPQAYFPPLPPPPFSLPMGSQSIPQCNPIHQSSFQMMPTMPNWPLVRMPFLPFGMQPGMPSFPQENRSDKLCLEGWPFENNFYPTWKVHNFNSDANFPVKKPEIIDLEESGN